MKKNTFEKKNQGEAISSLIKIWDLFEIFDIAKYDYVPKFIKKKFDGSSLLNTLLVKGFISNLRNLVTFL